MVRKDVTELEEELLRLLELHETAIRLDEAVDYVGVVESIYVRKKAVKAWETYHKELNRYIDKIKDVVQLGDPPTVHGMEGWQDA